MFDDCFAFDELKLLKGARGVFLAMPSRMLAAHCPTCQCKNHPRRGTATIAARSCLASASVVTMDARITLRLEDANVAVKSQVPSASRRLVALMRKHNVDTVYLPRVVHDLNLHRIADVISRDGIPLRVSIASKSQRLVLRQQQVAETCPG